MAIQFLQVYLRKNERHQHITCEKFSIKILKFTCAVTRRPDVSLYFYCLTIFFTCTVNKSFNAYTDLHSLIDVHSLIRSNKYTMVYTQICELCKHYQWCVTSHFFLNIHNGCVIPNWWCANTLYGCLNYIFRYYIYKKVNFISSSYNLTSD